MTIAGLVTTAKPLKDFVYFPPPKYAPAPSPEYPHNEYAEIAGVAFAIGLRLMPWQRFVIELATAYRLDSFGRRIYRFSKVLITVPRQSGKTTLMVPVRLHRIMTRPGIECFSTAQTGKDARKRIVKMIEQVSGSPLAGLFKPMMSNGSEGLQVRANLSTVTRFSPTLSALHGETPYLVDFDEIWKYPEQLGDYLIGAASPGGITLDGQQQIWMISTKGTASSTFMNKWVSTGIAGTEAGLAFFEWSMPPGMDPDDPRTWWAFHPALGNTITEDKLREEMYAEGMTRAERIRAYLNLLTEAVDPIIEPDDWRDLAGEPARPDPSEIVLGYDVAPKNELSTVAAAWRDADGRPCVRVVHQAPGAAWLPDYVRALTEQFGCRVAADKAGPAARITDDLDDLDVLQLDAVMRGTADMDLLTAARDENALIHDGSRPLATAVAHAVLRTTNGVSRVSRDASTAPVAAWIAASVALYGYDHPEHDPGDQIF